MFHGPVPPSTTFYNKFNISWSPIVEGVPPHMDSEKKVLGEHNISDLQPPVQLWPEIPFIKTKTRHAMYGLKNQIYWNHMCFFPTTVALVTHRIHVWYICQHLGYIDGVTIYGIHGSYGIIDSLRQRQRCVTFLAFHIDSWDHTKKIPETISNMACPAIPELHDMDILMGNTTTHTSRKTLFVSVKGRGKSCRNHVWLVVWTPLKNISQSGWWATQY